MMNFVKVAQSAGIVQYRHFAIAGFPYKSSKPEMTKCRYCTIPAICVFNTVISRNFHNFGSSGPIFKIFAFLETSSKFISTF